MANVFFTFKKIFKDYANGGNMLMLATVLALLVVNLPFSTEFYNSLWTHEMALQIGDFNLFSHHGEPMSVMAFINDALMAVFFFPWVWKSSGKCLSASFIQYARPCSPS